MEPGGTQDHTVGNWQPVLDAESGGRKRQRCVKIDHSALLHDGHCGTSQPDA